MIGQARNESNYVDSIRGIQTIKAMNREGLFAGIARDIFGAFQASVWQLGKIRVRFTTVLEITTALFGLTIIAWGAMDTLNGHLRIGQMIAILQLSGMLMQTAVLAALTNLQVQEAAVALDRMYEFMIQEPEYDAGAGLANTGPSQFRRLSVQQVGFRHPGKKLLLKNISLEVEKGEIIAITGDSGQGKSTLLQLLQKFYPGEGGMMRVNDQDLRSIDTVQWRRLIGVVPQDIAVFSGSLLANICLDLSPEHAEKVPLFCKALGFDRYFSAFPQGYATILGEGGVALSGGQRQLLALARCLYAGPQLILLDEPTAAMDTATEQFVIGVLQKFRQRAGILVISHKDALTAVADRVYRLDNGVTAGYHRTA
jgi:ATP-binding cassette subfamily B protein